ncbi:Mitochondrial small ribosomal subunit Rsm22, partial [Rhizoctonia solani]
MSFRATLARLRQNAINTQHAPNAPLQLDPALSQLLHDTDLSLLRKFRHGSKHYVERPELQVEETDTFDSLPPEYEGYEIAERGAETHEGSYWDGPREERRSPAAVYGTKHVGMVVLPWELEHAVSRVVEGETIQYPAQFLLTLAESDKHQLRSDAKRLFFYPIQPNTQPTTSSSGPSKIPYHKPENARSSNLKPEWQLSSTAPSLTFSTKGNYKTVVQLGPREALAFNTVVMPAHYAATANVFREISQRISGPGKGDDRIETVIDFGGKTGQGLWAALVTFREPISAPETGQDPSKPLDENANPTSWTPISASPHHLRVGPSSVPSIPTSSITPHNLENNIPHEQSWTVSTLKKYMLLDSRRGLTELARRLVKGTNIGECEVLYQDFWGKNTQLSVPERSLALCAFTLSELPDGTARKRMVTEMWQSGAEWMVIIDHGTPTGFDSVAQARELLLDLGRKELDSRAEGSEDNERALGSHVLAPCPHSHACPLHSSPNTRDICHFTQRVQTPPFLRHTKHSREGHEDVAYSYVVIRRGRGPVTHRTQQYGSPAAKGLVGAVGRESAEKMRLEEVVEGGKRKGQAKGKRKDRHGRQVLEVGEDGVWTGLMDTEAMAHEVGIERNDLGQTQEPIEPVEQNSEEEVLRGAIGTWPRIIYPPMKRSGHVIMDTCTNEGSIARITIPRSQGKQAYYDARKASWGDAFPHPPRITPLIRTRGIRRLGPSHTQPAADEPNIESETSELDDLRSTDSIDEDRINAFEVESEAGSSRRKSRDKSRRKGLRESRRRAAGTDLAPPDIETDSWLNREASELATQIQAEMEKNWENSQSGRMAD